MKIALRPSGGRGEYELAGSQGRVGVEDLIDRRLLFELTPEITIDSHSSVNRVQGKPRIRLEDPGRFSHAYSVLAGSLLLPLPRRELRTATTEYDFVRHNSYAISDIDVDVASVSAGVAELRPTVLWLQNAAHLTRSVDVALRMSQVQSLWDAAKSQDSDIAALVRSHETAVLGGDHGEIKRVARSLQKKLGVQGDVLDELASRLGMTGEAAAISSTTTTVPPVTVEDEVDPEDAARRAVARWRKCVVRSAQGRAFSQKVRAAYGNRCAVSGEVLPKLSNTSSPGVDGAHILPWARYDLNSLKNGICLNKFCHWAFDAGVIRIDCDAGRYVVSIPDRVRREGRPLGMSLGYFEALEGVIPEDRLPEKESDWPSAKYLERLNREIFG